MDHAKTMQMADLFGISRLAAARMRGRYLEAEIASWLEFDNPVAHWYAREAIGELAEVYGRALYAPPPQEGRLTEEEVERARSYPIERLVEFVRGRVRCFNHEDRRPSAYHMTRRNKLHCPVCQRSWNPVQLLMQRDGVGFREAVRRLT